MHCFKQTGSHTHCFKQTITHPHYFKQAITHPHYFKQTFTHPQCLHTRNVLTRLLHTRTVLNRLLHTRTVLNRLLHTRTVLNRLLHTRTVLNRPLHTRTVLTRQEGWKGQRKPISAIQSHSHRIRNYSPPLFFFFCSKERLLGFCALTTEYRTFFALALLRLDELFSSHQTTVTSWYCVRSCLNLVLRLSLEMYTYLVFLF